MKKLNLKDFKQTKDGRWINKTTGYFVRKPISTELNKLSQRSYRNNTHRRHHCSKKMVIRKYNVDKDRDYFGIDFGGFGDGDLMYISEMLYHEAKKDADKESKMKPDFLK